MACRGAPSGARLGLANASRLPGILPADTMRDYMPPIRLLFSRLVPEAFFEAYGAPPYPGCSPCTCHDPLPLLHPVSLATPPSQASAYQLVESGLHPV